MSAPRRVPALLAAAAALVLAVLVLGARDDDRTHLKLTLDSAGGLQNGSPASVGGVKVGKVELTLGKGDRVHADIALDPGTVIPRDARVAISAVNFLGQKQVSFTGGDRRRPAPDGYEFPASRVSTSTDLDQVLSALDDDTRARLALVLNEAGASVVGRRWDISRFVRETPKTLADANVLLDRLVGDNRTLRDLVTSTDRFVAAATAKQDDLVRMVDTVGQTAKTVETRRTELRATLARAPRTLATLQRFLARLEQTTVPLGPAARELTAAAPALRQTLERVDGFRDAAAPTLRTATDVAPALTRLADGATPTLRRATPAVSSVARLATALRPVSQTLDRSADNLIATIENWSQAIQLRDGVGHIFRGEATYSPNLLTSVLDRLNPPQTAAPPRRRKAAPVRRPQTQAAPATQAATGARRPDPLAPVTDAVKKTLGTVTGEVTKTLDGLLAPKAGGPAPDRSLLDFLLGP